MSSTNASFTKISAREASSLEKFSSLFVSSALYLTFSRSITSPSLSSAAIALALGPTTSASSASLTSTPRYSESLFATGARLNSGLYSPLGLPRCEQSITFAPCSIKYLIVGRAATILLSLVISPSLSGTLKSQRARTFLPFTSMSSIVFLFNASIVFTSHILIMIINIFNR